MFNKKMLLSVLIIGLVSVMAGSATWAYFTDTELSDDNTLTAGTLDLTLTDAPFTEGVLETDFYPASIGVAPGDSYTETQTIKNIGSLAGELDIAISAITNTESTGETEYERDITGGEGVGELGAVAEMLVLIDIDDSGTLTQSDIVLQSTGTAIAAPETPDPEDYFATIDSYGTDDFDSAIASMASNAEYDVLFMWRIPTAADNTIQGDSVSFDVTYTLEQIGVDP